MGFFDKLKDTVEKGAKNVSDNSKKMAEKMKLKKEMSQAEAAINAAYTEIGKKYFELNSESPSEEYAENITAIIEGNAKVEELKKALNALDDKIPCPNCGASLDKTQAFCDKCGTKIELPPETVAEEAKKAVCPACGEGAAEGQKFCEKCGTKIEADDAAEKVEAEVVEESAAE